MENESQNEFLSTKNYSPSATVSWSSSVTNERQQQQNWATIIDEGSSIAPISYWICQHDRPESQILLNGNKMFVLESFWFEILNVRSRSFHS